MTSNSVQHFFTGKPELPLQLFAAFMAGFSSIGDVEVSAAKTMIGISNQHRRVAWVTQVGRQFIHIVFPFKQPYPDNLCFTKIAQVPGTSQYNHHFRMLQVEDINDEVLAFMRLAYEEEA